MPTAPEDHAAPEDRAPAIRPARSDEQRSALELLLVGEPELARQLQLEEWLAECGPDGLADGLWIAEAGGKIVGAFLGLLRAGRSARFWPPQTLTGDPLLAQRLLRAGIESLVRGGATTARALLRGDRPADRELLLTAGFAHAADLALMFHFLSEPSPSASVGDLDFVRFEPSLRPRLAALIERTYVDSRDCPAINGAMAIDDVLDEHAAASDGDTSGWHLLMRAGVDVACLLLASDRAASFTQIAYMGVVPEARRLGIGRQMVQTAKSLARSAGQARLALAVDAANLPALRLYESMDFIAWDRRSLFFRRLTPAEPWSR